MIYILKHIKCIAYFLSILILFQSCAIYKRKSTPINEAAAPKNARIKVITRDGNIHYLKWIEEKDGNVYSIINTKRVFVKKDKIEKYMIYRPDPVTVPLEAALVHEGKVEILTWKYMKNRNKTIESKGEFIDIEDRGKYIRGVKVVSKSKEPEIIKIPINQIEAIKTIDKGLNAGITIIVSLSAIAVLLVFVVKNQ